MTEESFWHLKAAELFIRLKTTDQGLSALEAAKRLLALGENTLRDKKRFPTLRLFLSQFRSPFIWLLAGAALLSWFLSSRADVTMILLIIVLSASLSFFQERGAVKSTEKLLKSVQLHTAVIRQAPPQEIPITQIVPGDIVLLNAGDAVPGDCFLLESKDLSVEEASLTGEGTHVDKQPGCLPPNTPLAQRTNALFLGSHVKTGTARALVVHTGKQTVFGSLTHQLSTTPPQTAFERGLLKLGYFLMFLTILLTVTIFLGNILLARPLVESFLFALALSVGFTPQLLPAIVSVTLAHGAKRMGQQKVIVKKGAAIEDFGSMTIFCSDKTGTLTEGHVTLEKSIDPQGEPNQKVALFACVNACLQSGYTNPIDQTLKNLKMDISQWEKLDEVPYNFTRKRLSILVRSQNQTLLITKGAFPGVLEKSTQMELSSGEIISLDKGSLEKQFEALCSQGFRPIAIAYRSLTSKKEVSEKEESDLIFLGFLLFSDPPKKKVAHTILELKKLGIDLKVLTGDHRFMAAHLARQIQIPANIVTGDELDQLSEKEVAQLVEENNIFAEVQPAHKERIILILRKLGHTVGYLGDGINDVTALHAADIGISAAGATDAAQDIADVVLLTKDLNVLPYSVREGRRTFANTLKYIFMATSANFGNMFSVAGASLFLPFLPLLPKQILLTNLLTDFPEMAIATDSVDESFLSKPLQWNMGFIRKFMIVFGLISSVFDFITFGALYYLLHASPEQFRTGWFIESVISAATIILVVRTRHAAFRSRPSKPLALAVAGIFFITLALPYSPIASAMYFTHLPYWFYLLIFGIVTAYIVTAELAKKIFYRFVR